MDGLTDLQVTPSTGDKEELPSRQSRIHRRRIRRTTLCDLQGILELFKGRTVGFRAVLLQSFQQVEQLLRPELLIAPVTK